MLEFPQVFLLSTPSCFGVLFSSILNSLNVSSTNVTWILNVHVFLWNLSSMLTGPLCRRFGWRRVGCVGAGVLSVAFMSMSFVLSPVFIFIMFSIVIGESYNYFLPYLRSVSTFTGYKLNTSLCLQLEVQRDSM